MDPSDFLAIDRGCVSLPNGAAKEMELHCFFRILMADDAKGDGRIDPYTQFFVQFALQAFFQGFALLALSAWKLPQPGQMHACPALGDQVATFVNDQTGGHFDELCHQDFPLNGKDLQIGFIVHPWQDGVRAVQQSAPKSMSA